MVINKFDGEYEWLSNFYKCKVYLDGIDYDSVEHAYQAAKTLDLIKRNFIRSLLIPAQAKKIGKTVKLRDDWDEIKDDAMYNLVFQKFSNNQELKEKLLSTENIQIIEENWWHDTYWGVCNGVGKNKLGHILMFVRTQLQRGKEKYDFGNDPHGFPMTLSDCFDYLT